MIRTPRRCSIRASAATPISSSSNSASLGREELEGEGILLTGKVLPQGLTEHLRASCIACTDGAGPMAHVHCRALEERHARAEFQVIGVAEDLLDRTTLDAVHQPRALAQARPQDRVREIGARLLDGGKRVAPCRGARAETLQLWKDEPHPVAILAPGRKLGTPPVEYRLPCRH